MTRATTAGGIDRPDLRAQRAYRKRRAAKIERLEKGCRDVLAKLEGNTKPLAVEIRAIAERALSGETA